MDSGSEKGFAPSRPFNSSPKRPSTRSTENDENDPTIPMLENHKEVVSKHFMLSAVAAACKASSPRKRVLGEKNDVSMVSDPQQYRSVVNLCAEKCPQDSVFVESDQCNNVSEANEKGDSHSPDDCIVKRYDPFTNYLSPRPQYLRFNPNRRFEILNRLENEGIDLNGLVCPDEVSDEELPSVDEVEYSCLSSTKIDENTEQVDDEYDEEEVKAETGSCLVGMLKHLVVLVGFLMFMSYISPMDSPAPLPTELAAHWNLTDGYLLVKEQTLDFVSTIKDDAGLLIEAEKVFDDGSVGGDSEEMIEVNEEIWLEDLGVWKVRNDIEDENSEEMIEGNEDLGNWKARNDIEDEVSEDMIKGNEEVFESLADENVGNEDKVDVGDEADAFEFKDGDFQQVMGLEKEEVGFEIIGDEEVVFKNEDVARYGLETTEGLESSQGLSEDVSKHGLESEDPETSQEWADEELIESGETLGELGYQNEVEMQKLRWSISAVVGVFLGSILLATFAFVYTSKKARNVAKKSKAAAKKQPRKKVTEEKKIAAATTTPPPGEKKVEFLARPFVHQPAGEAPTEFNYRIHAPIVELMGEIVVGERKSLKSAAGANKFQASEFKESNATYFPKRSSLPQQISTPVHKSSAFDYTNSSSYGSSGTEKISLKNEGGGQNGEAGNQAATPLRRSSRIRSRAAPFSS